MSRDILLMLSILLSGCGHDVAFVQPYEQKWVTTSHAGRDGWMALDGKYDLDAIRSALRNCREYLVTTDDRGALHIVRRFDRVTYGIVISNENGRASLQFESTTDPGPRGGLPGAMPNKAIARQLAAMIRDMSLSRTQRDELLGAIAIGSNKQAVAFPTTARSAR